MSNESSIVRFGSLPTSSPPLPSQQVVETSQQRYERQQQIWIRVDAHLKKMRLDRSPFVPKGFEDYENHLKALRQNDIMAQMYPQNKEKLQPIVLDMACVRHCGLEKFIDPKRLEERQLQICGLTVFAPLWQPSAVHPEAPWPVDKEFQEDGDERFTSQYGRFLPIPRLAVYPRMLWKNAAYVKPCEWDKVYPVPKMYVDIRLPNDHDTVEPEVNDDGVYIDNFMTAGRIAYAGEPAPGEVAASARDLEWESQYFRKYLSKSCFARY